MNALHFRRAQSECVCMNKWREADSAFRNEGVCGQVRSRATNTDLTLESLIEIIWEDYELRQFRDTEYRARACRASYEHLGKAAARERHHAGRHSRISDVASPSRRGRRHGESRDLGAQANVPTRVRTRVDFNSPDLSSAATREWSAAGLFRARRLRRGPIASPSSVSGCSGLRLLLRLAQARNTRTSLAGGRYGCKRQSPAPAAIKNAHRPSVADIKTPGRGVGATPCEAQR